MTLKEYFQTGRMTRQEFAVALGVSAVSVYRWENGHRLPVRHFGRISELTNDWVTANDFVRREEEAR